MSTFDPFENRAFNPDVEVLVNRSHESSRARRPRTTAAPIIPGLYTGGLVVTFRGDDARKHVSSLAKEFGLDVASSLDYESRAVDGDTLRAEGTVVFDSLGVAVVNPPPDERQEVAAAITRASEDDGSMVVEPERILYAFDAPAAKGGTVAPGESDVVTVDYLHGFFHGQTGRLVRVLPPSHGSESGRGEHGGATVADSAENGTWGLQATGVDTSPYGGKGVRVAVLDTGIDLQHPDFAGRGIMHRSFVPGQEVQDRHGHGTHCAGTIWGPRQGGMQARYGVAPDAELYVGKVLGDDGSGEEKWILAGMEWAIGQQCQVISMSLSGLVFPGMGYSAAHEQVGKVALQNGLLIVVAVGNDSRRGLGHLVPVGHPANCPSLLGVGAVDYRLHVADFSNRAINGQGAEVDLMGPGVAVYSSWPMPLRYRSIDGTSMATPHVAGIAALWLEKHPGDTGEKLRDRLLSSARRLNLPKMDVGAGLVQAPQ